MLRVSLLVLVIASLAAVACGDPPAQDPSDLTQFPAASSAPHVASPPASSADAVWPDAGLKK